MRRDEDSKGTVLGAVMIIAMIWIIAAFMALLVFSGCATQPDSKIVIAQPVCMFLCQHENEEANRNAGSAIKQTEIEKDKASLDAKGL